MTQQNNSFWDRLMQKLTKSTPVERENEIKLDHDFDGIEELNNPLPPWWSAGFIITVVISIFYVAFYFYYFYDANNNGKWQEHEYQKEVAAHKAQIEAYKKAHGVIDENTVKVVKDAKSLAEGKAIFQKNCAACHRADGGGSVGPNLTDKNWLYGCDAKSLFKVINDGTSKGMPPWKNLGGAKIQKVISYILVDLQAHPAKDGKAPEGEVCNQG